MNSNQHSVFKKEAEVILNTKEGMQQVTHMMLTILWRRSKVFCVTFASEHQMSAWDNELFSPTLDAVCVQQVAWKLRFHFK